MNISNPFKKVVSSGLRSQLIMGIALIIVLSISMFVADLVSRQKAFFLKINHDRGIGLSDNLANIATSHVVAYELDGLQNLISSYKKMPGLEYALVTTSDGIVLAHTNRKYLGLKPSDSISAKLKPVGATQVLIENNDIFDVASPIINHDEIVGWARIGLSQKYLTSNISEIRKRGILYILISLVIGSLFAILVAGKLSKGLQNLIESAQKIKEGDRELRVAPSKSIEVTQVGIAMNQMLDHISANEKLLAMVLANMPVGVFILDEHGKIISANPAAQQIWEGVKYVGMDDYNVYKGWFPNGKEIEWDEWGAVIALKENKAVLNQEIEIEGFDGSRKTILNSCLPLHDDNEKIVGAIAINFDITERKNTEEKIRAGEKTRKHIINSALDAIIGMDKNGLITIWTPQAERIFGWKEEEVIGKRMSEIIIPEQYRVHHERGLERYIKEGKGSILNKTIEVASLHRSGREFPVELSIAVVNDADNDFFCAFIRDISERKEAEKRIRQSEEKNRALIENISDTIILINEKLEVVYQSPSFIRTAGFTLDDHKGKTIWEIIHPDELEECLDIKHRSEMAPGIAIPFQQRTLHKKGFYIWIEGTVTNLLETESVKAFVLNYRNITERKKFEEQQLLMTSIVNSSEDAIISKTLEGIVTSWNHGAESILGYSTREIIGNSIQQIIPPHLLNEESYILNRIKKGQSVDHYETVRRKKNGEQIFVSLTVSPIFDSAGKITGASKILRNISDRKHMELEREKTMTELLQRNRDLEQFSYIVSHNLRAPVATIIGLSDVLRDKQLNHNEKEKFLNGMGVSAQKLDMVIRDLNMILQVKRDLSEKKELIRFSELINDIKVSLNLTGTEKVQFICDFNSTNEITTIKSYLYSIFYNLISNSIKYSKPNVDPVIEISSEIIENTTILHFKDNGLGIDIQKKGKHVFGLYKRFHLHLEGKGMGLFMVKSQVEALGGKISIQSSENIGTEFKIEFKNQVKKKVNDNTSRP